MENNINNEKFFSQDDLKISEYHKKQLLKDGFVNIPQDDHDDELKVRLSLQKDGNIEAFWYNGEIEYFKKEQIVTNVKNSLKDDLKIDLNITSDQRKAFSDYFEYGITSDKASLSPEQAAKIPDIIDNNLLSSTDKILLATEGLELKPFGLKYSINENNNLERIQLNDDLIEEKSLVQNKDVKFKDMLLLTPAEIKVRQELSHLNTSNFHKELANRYAAELSKPTDLSKGLNVDKISEKQSYHWNLSIVTGEDFKIKESLNKLVEQFNEPQYKNFNFLKDQIKFLGFGTKENLHLELANKITQGADNFKIDQHTEMNHFKSSQIKFELSFNKSKETGNVFLNSYEIKLNNKEKEQYLSFTVDLKKIPFSAKEAVNLIEGRSVRTEINLKNGDKEDVFIKIDFQNPNENGKYNLNKFFPNYGVNTSEILKKSNVLIANDEIKNKLIKSLEKGNVVPVIIKNIEGNNKLNAVLNPQFKTLNLYDFKMQRVSNIQSIQNTNISTEKQTSENNMQQSTQRKL